MIHEHKYDKAIYNQQCLQLSTAKQLYNYTVFIFAIEYHNRIWY